MALSQSKSVEKSILIQSQSSSQQENLTGLFKTFKNIRANNTLPEPVKTQQLRAHAALIYEQLSSKSQHISN